MTQRHMKQWRRRLKAGTACLAGLLFAVAPSYAQKRSKSDASLPICKLNFKLADLPAEAELYQRSSSKPAVTYITLKPALKRQNLYLSTLRNFQSLPDLEWLIGYSAQEGVQSLGINFSISPKARFKLPQPTGCSFFAGKDRTYGPKQMRGIDNIAHDKPNCSTRLQAGAYRAVAAADDFKVTVHDGNETILVEFVFDTNFQSQMQQRLDQVSRLLNQRAAMTQCRASSLRPGKIIGAPCFITTAACDVVGLADDCWELAQLRAFRDSWLVHQPGGQDDVAQYYAQAPAICAAMQNSREGRRQLLNLYWLRIVPCAITARLGLNRLTRRWYTAMMTDLMALPAAGVEAHNERV